MTVFETALSILVGLLTVLTIVAPFIHKVIRGNIMEEVNTLVEEKIGDSLEEYESKNENIRRERQLRYAENLETIRKSIDTITFTLVKIESDIQAYSRVSSKQEVEISSLRRDVDALKK